MNNILLARDQIKKFCKELVNCFHGELQTLVKEKTFLTGGCYKSLILGELPKDYDFYFKDKDSVNKFIELIDKGLKTRATPFTNVKELKLKDFAYQTNNAITFNFNGVIVQFITRFFGSPTEVTSKFDFSHCTNYYDLVVDKFTIQAPEHNIVSKKLTFNVKATHPVNAIKRLTKLISQGWTIDDTEIMKIALAINMISLNTKEDINNQSIGMYATDYSDLLIERRNIHNSNFKNKVNDILDETHE